MNQEQSFKASTPVGPKPGVQRPMLLRGKAAKSIKAKKSAVLCKPEIDANLLAFQLMNNALAEEAKSAGEDCLLYESDDESLDEMDDEVLSLGGQSESEEEGDLVHLAYNFAKGAVGQGVDIDFAKAIHNASEEISTCKDFVDISELSEAEDVEDLRVNEAAALGREGAAGGKDLAVEDTDLEGLDLLRQNAKKTLLSAAGDGSLVMALKAVVGAQVDEAMQVESLRLEARNAMLKAAGNGRLAQALKQMRKALPEEKVAVQAAEEPQDDAKEVSVSEVINAKAAPKHPGQEDFGQGTARALKLAWCMAGSPARSLRQKDVRKALQGERFCRPSLQAYPFVEHVQAEDKRDSEPIGAPGRSADHLAQPRLTTSASAISLGLSRAKVGLRCVNSRCSSVGSLRPLKVKGPVLPPALPPTAFLHKHEPAAKQGV